MVRTFKTCIATESVYYIPLNLCNYTNYAKYYSKILLCRAINVHSVSVSANQYIIVITANC